MKKNLFYVMSLAAVFSLGSCSQEDLADVKQEDGVKLGIASVSTTISQSRAVVEGTSLPTGAKLGVFAGSYLNKLYTATGTGVNQIWNSTDAPILTSTAVDAYAYYPHNPAATNIEAIPVNLSSGDDFMYCDAPCSVKSSSNEATFAMKHVAALIRIVFKKGTYLGDGYLYRTQIDSEYFSRNGTFNLKTKQYTPTDTDSKSGYFNEYVDDNIDASGSIVVDYLVYPLESTPCAFNIYFDLDDLTDCGGFMWTDAGVPPTITAGKKYTFEVTVNNESSSVKAVSVSDWGVGGTYTYEEVIY